MKSNLVRRGAWGVLVGLALLSSVPVLSASSAGAIELTGLSGTNTPFTRSTTDLEWVWQAGTDVRHSSLLSLRVYNAATGARVVNRYRYVRDGRYTWDTTTVPDGVYIARATVRYTDITSALSPIYVDNTAPTVEITRPARGANSIYVQDNEVGFDKTVVVGLTKLEAAASDNLSGINDASLTWYLDGNEIELNEAEQYDFSTVAPGEHTLEVYVTDVAGNRSEPASEPESTSPHSSLSIVVVGVEASGPDLGELPDPGAPDPNEIVPSETPDPGAPDPNEIVPSEIPDPGAPDPNEIVPSEDPTVPNPDPSQTPDPGSLLPVPPPEL